MEHGNGVNGELLPPQPSRIRADYEERRRSFIANLFYLLAIRRTSPTFCKSVLGIWAA